MKANEMSGSSMGMNEDKKTAKASKARKPVANKSGKQKNLNTKNSNKKSSRKSHDENGSLLMRGKEAVSGAYDWASDSADRIMPDRRSFRHLIQEQPFVVGAIGLGLGAILGMMLPNNMTSNLSSERKRKAH